MKKDNFERKTFKKVRKPEEKSLEPYDKTSKKNRREVFSNEGEITTQCESPTANSGTGAAPEKLKHKTPKRRASAGENTSDNNTVLKPCTSNQQSSVCVVIQKPQLNGVTLDTNLSQFELSILAGALKNIAGEIFRRSTTDTPFVPAAELSAVCGDIIEIDRGMYFHYALYASHGHVIHVTGDNNVNTDFSLSLEAFIRKQTVEEVVAESLCRVNNKECEAMKRQLASHANLSGVVQELHHKLDEKVPYHVLSQNCETYVTQWRYGHGWSNQSEIIQQRFGMLLAGLIQQTTNLGTVITQLLTQLANDNKTKNGKT